MLYARALDVCTFVQSKALVGGGQSAHALRPEDLPRFQKVLLTRATIQGMTSSDSSAAVSTYFKALELMTSSLPAYVTGHGYSTRELILATLVTIFILQTPSDGHLPSELSDTLDLPRDTSVSSLLSAKFSPLDAVRASGDRVLEALLRLGGNALPFTLLLPEQVGHLLPVLFPSTSGVLPAICTVPDDQGRPQTPSEDSRQESNTMTGTVLLALAKRYQDLSTTEVSLPGFSGKLNVNHSLAIMFYYLALALSPSPSTYNNMGIILSMMSAIQANIASTSGETIVMTASNLARLYYSAGLQREPNHPHLLTNLGSLYKDKGNLDEAIE